MTIFIYEYLTAMGIGRPVDSPGHGLYREGRAMRDAVVADAAKIPHTRVLTWPDDSDGNDKELFLDLCRRADWTLLIAPESGGCLHDLASRVEQAGGRLLGPSSDVIRITSDKLALARHWREHGVPTPATTDRLPSECEAFPVVWKPRDGCGSTDTYLLTNARDVAAARASVAAKHGQENMILQEYVEGLTASIAFICGPQGNRPLPAARQILSSDGRFHYRGGELPLEQSLSQRAAAIGQQALESLGVLNGYIGVDLILGEDEEGSQDSVIEINPRLTTSYVGLRELAKHNLVESMIAARTSCADVPWSWKKCSIKFSVMGTICRT